VKPGTSEGGFAARQRAGLDVLRALSAAQALERFASADTDLLNVPRPGYPGRGRHTRSTKGTIVRKLILTAITGAFTTGLVLLGMMPAGAAVTHPKPQLRFAASAAPPVAKTHTMTTKIYLNPDSGDAGNTWALDTFVRVVTITRSGGKRGYEYAGGKWQPYPVSDCGGGIRCYHYTFTIEDTGRAAVIAGQQSPGKSQGEFVNLDVAENAQMGGGTSDGQFFSSYKNEYAKYFPVSMDENGVPATGNYTTGNWVMLGQPGAHFQDVSLGASAGWTYIVPAGRDARCPAYKGTWIDSFADGWGVNPDSGNVLAPNAADCAAQSGTG
jgi:hypothetical protein